MSAHAQRMTGLPTRSQLRVLYCSCIGTPLKRISRVRQGARGPGRQLGGLSREEERTRQAASREKNEPRADEHGTVFLAPASFARTLCALGTNIRDATQPRTITAHLCDPP